MTAAAAPAASTIITSTIRSHGVLRSALPCTPVRSGSSIASSDSISPGAGVSGPRSSPIRFRVRGSLKFGSNSKTALVALILVPLLMLLFTGLRGHATLYGGVAFGLVSSGLLGAAFVTTNLGPITQSLGRDATLTGRTQLWGDVIHEIGRHPWVGFGWLGYWTGTMDGPSRYVLERNTWNPPNAHNAVLEIMLNLGTIGAVLFLIPYVRGLFRSIGQVRRVPNILGLFPITYFSFVLLQSITEIGVVGRDLTWTLFVVAAVFATGDRSYGALAGAGPVPVSTDLHPSRNEATVPARAIGPSDVDAAPRAGDRAGDADHAEPAGAAAPARGTGRHRPCSPARFSARLTR